MIRVAAALIERDGRLLIAQRKKGDECGHKWEFPGGTILPGETAEECLARELYEELGIRVQVERFVCSSRVEQAGTEIELLLYEASHLGGAFRLEAHERLAWVLPAELERYDLAEADARLLPHIIAR
jgi:mutator protein MutT